MSRISENTVPSESQMKTSPVTGYIGEENAAHRILILGNSITRHAPASTIGWLDDWGMAASAEEKDFVHRYVARLREAGLSTYVMVRQASYWEGHYTDADIFTHFEEERAFAPDLIVYRLGENVHNPFDAAVFTPALEAFLRYVAAPHTRFLLTTCFWPSPTRDECTRAVAEKMGGVCLELGDLGQKDEMMALGLFEHHGVSIHPGDLGMDTIAARVFAASLPLLKK